MARVRRLKVQGETAFYHIISRTVGGEFYLGDVEKEMLVSIIRRFSRLFLVDVVGFCVMSNHFPLPTLLAKQTCRPDRDAPSLSVCRQVRTYLIVADDREIPSHGDAHILRLYFTAKLQRCLFLPVGLHLFPTETKTTSRPHVSHIILVRPYAFHWP